MSEPSREFAETFERPPEEPIDLDAYWRAPCAPETTAWSMDPAYTWQDKPHRLLYDCLREIHHLRKATPAVEVVAPVAHQVSAEQRLLERTLAAEAERDRWRALAECEAGIKAPEGWEWFPYDEEEAAMWLSGDSYVYRDANGVFHGVFLHRRTPEISGPYRYYLEAIEAANQAAEQDALADSAATGMVAEARQGEE